MVEQTTLPVPVPTAATGSTFKATMENSRVIKGIIEAISFLIDETYIYMRPDGMKLNAIDSSHVAMLLAFLPKELFTEYKCEQDAKVGISVADLVKVLRRAKATDEVQLRVEAKDKNTLLLTLKGDKSTRTFKLKSKEIPGYDAKEEGLLESFEETLKDKFSASVSFDCAVLDEVVKDASIISDLLKVNVNAAEKQLVFNASDESGEVDIQIDLEGKGVLAKDVKNDAEGIYSLNFLENIIKVQTFIDHFEIAMGNNIPMKIKGAIKPPAPADGKLGLPSTVEGKIVYLLAPRVEDQNEDEFGDDVEDDDVKAPGSADEPSGDEEV